VFHENRLADKESRKRFCEAGELWYLSLDQCEHPGTREEGMGTGNMPAWGRADFRMNRQHLRKSISEGMHVYANERRKLREATVNGNVARDDALVCVVLSSVAGGEGSGAYADICRETRSLALDLGIQVNLNAIPLDIGTIAPPNKVVALRNRKWALNNLRIELTGHYRDPEGLNAQLVTPLVDRVLVSSNAGTHSEVATLDEQEALLANQLYYWFYTPLGERLREDIVDVDANRGVDDSGAPRAGSAMGTCFIHLDRGKVKRFVGACHAVGFASRILGADTEGAKNLGRQAASQLHLREDDVDNQTSRYLTLAGGQGADAFAEVEGSFKSRHEGLHGWPRVQAVRVAYQDIISQLIPAVLVPRMEARAKALQDEVRGRWAKEMAPWSKELAGLSKAKGFLNGLIGELRESKRANSQKLEDTSQVAAAVALQIDEYQEEVDALARRTRLGRLLRCLSVYAVAGDFVARLSTRCSSRNSSNETSTIFPTSPDASSYSFWRRLRSAMSLFLPTYCWQILAPSYQQRE